MSNIDDEYDFEDVDCEDCGRKFFVRPSVYSEETNRERVVSGRPRKEWPTKCERCQKGLPPTYEY